LVGWQSIDFLQFLYYETEDINSFKHGNISFLLQLEVTVFNVNAHSSFITRKNYHIYV